MNYSRNVLLSFYYFRSAVFNLLIIIALTAALAGKVRSFYSLKRQVVAIFYTK